MTFTRKKEDFICEHCAQNVVGDGYTNHCPKCLWSKHVDIDPGDRAATCHGMMRPIATRYEHDTFIVYHQCTVCNVIKKNKSVNDDAKSLLHTLVNKPLP
ncbi:MAG: RNHCP domain-containing protein [Patescibacteria group bacterium]